MSYPFRRAHWCVLPEYEPAGSYSGVQMMERVDQQTISVLSNASRMRASSVSGSNGLVM
jgi:hypothetical protein